MRETSETDIGPNKKTGRHDDRHDWLPSFEMVSPGQRCKECQQTPYNLVWGRGLSRLMECLHPRKCLGIYHKTIPLSLHIVLLDLPFKKIFLLIYIGNFHQKNIFSTIAIKETLCQIIKRKCCWAVLKATYDCHELFWLMTQWWVGVHCGLDAQH